MKKKEYKSGEKVGACFFVEEIDNENLRLAKFKCTCGTEFEAHIQKVRTHKISSCGCKEKSNRGKASITHGMSDTPEYRVWLTMKRRCNDPNNHKYESYGLRGIKVCVEWENSFEQFITDMGRREFKGASIERRDNSKGYCKNNCFWANPTTQARNRRSNLYLEYDNKRMLLIDWAKETGIPMKRISSRLKRGWSVERSLSTM